MPELQFTIIALAMLVLALVVMNLNRKVDNVSKDLDLLRRKTGKK
ncbi:MAG TPA: hypothetical protein VGB16_02125 [candidate division Zixibacteria bacterium]